MLKKGLQSARGYFDFVEYLDGQLTIKGWMLLPDKRFDKISLFISQKFVCETEIVEKDDVQKAFPFIQHARFSGFAVSIERNAEEMKGLIDICLVGSVNGQEVAKMDTCYSKEVDLPDFPTHLIKRVANSESRYYARASSFKSFYDFWKPVCKYMDPGKIRTMLDWGCGCGRIISVFQKLTEISEIHGCDIDREAIDWCKKSFRYANFVVIPPTPPTEYPDNLFNLVIGSSVFTHLTRDIQHAWLEEMNRIIAPGGLFLASVHGKFAADFNLQNFQQAILGKDGFYDEIKDMALDDIAPRDYYRATYQSQKYTMEVFGKYFEILKYIDRGVTNLQDLVVMKKDKY